MFNKPSIDDYYREAQEKIKQDIASRPDTYILSVNLREFSDYLFHAHAFQPIEYDKSRQTGIEKARRNRQVNDYGKTITVERVSARIRIPIVANQNLRKIMELMPSSFTTSPPDIEAIGDELVIESELDEGKIQAAINEVKREVEWRCRDIRQQNEELKGEVAALVKARKEKIQNEEELFDRIAKKIPVVLERKDKPVATIVPQVRVKETIKPIVPPKPSQPEELQLGENKFRAILELIDNTCRAFEMTPTTFSRMGEEDLRDVILSSLNGIFAGDAVGEAFSKQGKVDIFLKVSKGGIFIAECKFWDGKKTLEEVVSQILERLTWRNSYGVAILFSKNRDFTNVIETMKTTIPSLPLYVKSLQDVSSSHFRSIHHLKEDDRKLIEIHYLAYNLCAEKVVET